MKKFFLASASLVVIAAFWFLALQLTTPSLPPVTHLPLATSAGSLPPSQAKADAVLPGEKRMGAPVPLERLDLAKDLNAPGKTIQDDLHLLESVFLAWQSNFLKEGNPVGENVEITAALTGNNSLHLAFLAPDHLAINPNHELCDRWGTPFFFHQLSGSKMEIRSAGPDHIRGTRDDAVLQP